ncbi:MAG: hypothetical protein B6D39_09245 [Anaerolineae bacterium UTCFX2]|jgi:DNA-3-methyladenine glycosylase II|nr:DNA-3-methyladenine glycosylase 2 family protein [Anaerolineae bacterium]MCZ7552757.1 hypothetical protein [Anaerolineales bacterium]OQY89723.1 MAG: hypothetical protein B6D39_09245 [Anaerolineae bacterium UTCFX2]
MIQGALSEIDYQKGLKTLSKRDADLAQVIQEFGPPPFWQREPGFPTLVYIILEQQVSLASARAAYDRLKKAAAPLTPQSFLEFDDAQLKTIGFSRQKTRYCRELAHAILEGRLDLTWLETAADDEARAKLTEQKGIGAWTAEIYLLMALRRPDAWPTGDLALANAVKAVKNLAHTPDTQRMEELGAAYRPWRAVAARLFWHYYLSKKGLT